MAKADNKEKHYFQGFEADSDSFVQVSKNYTLQICVKRGVFMDALKWIWNYVKKYRLSMLIALIFTAFFIACAFIIPVVLGRIVDDVIYLLFFIDCFCAD